MLDNPNTVSHLEQRIDALEKIDNPNAQPQVKNAIGLFVTADLLYWWTDIAGIPYAIQRNSGFSKGKIKNPKVDPDLGFKIGIGWRIPHDGWDCYLNLTHLHSRAHIHKQSHDGKLLTPTWTLPQPNIANPFVDSVDGHWRLHFAFIDLELGRSFFVSRYLTLRPHIGLRYGIIRQKYLLNYFGGDLFPGGKSYISMKNKFIAPGLRAGLDLDWKIKGGWSLYSALAFSLLYGEHYVHESEEVSFEEEKRFNIWNKFPSEKPIIDLALGIGWDRMLSKSRYHLGFHLGFEQHYLFAQNQFFHFTSTAPLTPIEANEALSLQGITFGGRFDF